MGWKEITIGPVSFVAGGVFAVSISAGLWPVAIVIALAAMAWDVWGV
jgi:hypothetical protein